MLLNTVPAKLEGLKGGALPGLRRVVGGAKKMEKAASAARSYMSILHGKGEDSGDESEMEEMEEKKPKRGGAAGDPSKYAAIDIYAKGVATKRTQPGGIKAKAEQGADYAPRWFRNSGDIAGGAMCGEGMSGGDMCGEGMSGGARKPRAKRMLSDRQKARNALVRKLMSERGMKLGEASRYIKENDLI
jgi:hypothetical protein